MEPSTGPVKLFARPQLRRPYLVAAWAGMGAVGLLAANYLRQELGASLLGEIEPQAFFSPSQVYIKDGLIRGPELPTTRFYYWDKGAAHDLLIVVGTEQPAETYEMAQCVLNAAQQFGVERVYTCAAFPTFIHHTHEPAVWGTATHAHLAGEMEVYDVQAMDQGSISGLNGLLLAVALERGLEGLCLLGEIPVYATQMINPKASSAVLAVLSGLLQVEIDRTKLLLWAEDLRPEMDKLYDVLPARIREVTENPEGQAPSLPMEAHGAEQPFVADETFFDEIARFLEQHSRSESDRGEGEDPDSTPG
ncbi:MAG: PAC2 family protein [Anaerolineae bacterium]|jgi:proteasome assembly chaperone (PAC2) family protein|nr:PAC2 family protein [Anaerolineae bacterium]